MKKMSHTTGLILVFGLAATLGSQAEAQLGLQANQSARVAANVTERVRTQVQQQVQAQVQSQVQQQVQAQIQGQVQQQVQAQVQQQLQTQLQQQVQAATQERVQAQNQQRVQTGTQLRLDSNLGLGLGVGAQTNTQMRTETGAGKGVAGGLLARQNMRADGAAVLSLNRPGIPVIVNAQEMTHLDVVFGKYNPFKQQVAAESNLSGGLSAATSAAASAAQSTRNSTEASAAEQGNDVEARRQNGVGLIFRSQADLDASINTAVRQRRAEIASVRDRALVEGNAALLAQADQNERMLEAFSTAEARAQAQANTAVQNSARPQTPPGAIIRTNAEAQGQGRVVVPAGGQSPNRPAEPAATPRN